MKHITNSEDLQKKKENLQVSDKVRIRKKLEIPFWKKSNLTLEEAAAYSGIGINRLRTITNEKGCNFVIFIGTKRLIKRKKLDEFIDEISVL